MTKSATATNEKFPYIYIYIERERERVVGGRLGLYVDTSALSGFYQPIGELLFWKRFYVDRHIAVVHATKF